MTKRKFLAKLESALSSLSAEERNRQLDYYEEMIDDMIEEGMGEEEAVSRLGSVQGVAAKILSEASPDMLKKKKSPLKKILIALAIVVVVVIAGTVLLFSLFKFDHNSGIQQLDDIDDIVEERMEIDDRWIDVEDIVENKLEAGGEWLFGADESFDAGEFDAIAIEWGAGSVRITESEGRSVAVKTNRDDALEYKLDDGVLCIKNTEKYENEKANLTVAVPEDMMRMNVLCVVTASGDVNIDSEAFAGLEIVTASGNIRIDENEAEYIQVVTASGNVMISADEDDAFTLDYATQSGDVSVGFDRGFKNKSRNGKNVSYDHGLGSKNCMEIEVVTASGDIMIVDD